MKTGMARPLHPPPLELQLNWDEYPARISHQADPVIRDGGLF